MADRSDDVAGTFTVLVFPVAFFLAYAIVAHSAAFAPSYNGTLEQRNHAFFATLQWAMLETGVAFASHGAAFFAARRWLRRVPFPFLLLTELVIGVASFGSLGLLPDPLLACLVMPATVTGAVYGAADFIMRSKARRAARAGG